MYVSVTRYCCVVVPLLTVGVTAVAGVNITALSVLVCLVHILYVQ